jgi:hypothetical protein
MFSYTQAAMERTMKVPVVSLRGPGEEDLVVAGSGDRRNQRPGEAAPGMNAAKRSDSA